jgi:pimeloyl-ACP methyl ester carboxylesterase
MGREQAEQKVRRMFPPALADVADAQLQAGVFPGPLGASYVGMAGREFSAMLSRYPGPSLILNGEKDAAARRGENQFAAAARQGSVLTIQGAGHACNLDQSEKFNQAVREFAHAIGWSTHGASWQSRSQ